MNTPSESPQARLAASRKALVRQMAGYSGRVGHESPNGLSGSSDPQTDSAQDGGGRSSMWQVISQAVAAWWQHHPAQVAIDIGRPFLSNYAREKPLRLLGIAAGIGAAAILVKPWRLVSVTGLAVAALKSTRLSTTLLSLLPRLPKSAPRQYSQKPQQPLRDRG